MDYQQSRQVILTATLLRAQGQQDKCIALMLQKMEQIDPDIRFNAWMEVFGAAKDKGDKNLAHQAAQEIAREFPDLPSIRDYL